MIRLSIKDANFSLSIHLIGFAACCFSFNVEFGAVLIIVVLRTYLNPLVFLFIWAIFKNQFFVKSLIFLKTIKGASFVVNIYKNSECVGTPMCGMFSHYVVFSIDATNISESSGYVVET